MTHGSPASRKALELLVRLYEILVGLAPPVEDRAVFCSTQHLCVCVCVVCFSLHIYNAYPPHTHRYTHTHHARYTSTDAQTHTHTSWCSDPWQRWHCVHSREKVSCISLTCMCVCVSVYILCLSQSRKCVVMPLTWPSACMLGQTGNRQEPGSTKHGSPWQWSACKSAAPLPCDAGKRCSRLL